MYKTKTSGAIVMGTAPTADVMLGRCVNERVRVRAQVNARKGERERRQMTHHVDVAPTIDSRSAVNIICAFNFICAFLGHASSGTDQIMRK
jgi:hypothetical protein